MYTFDTEAHKNHPADDPTHHLNLSAIADVRRISARGVTGKNSMVVAKLLGLPQRPMADITFEDMHFDGGLYNCTQVHGTYHDVQPKPTCAELVPAAEREEQPGGLLL